MFMDQKIRHPDIVKMPFLPKLMCRFNEILGGGGDSADIFLEIGKLVLKLRCKCKGPRLAKNWGVQLQAKILHVIF